VGGHQIEASKIQVSLSKVHDGFNGWRHVIDFISALEPTAPCSQDVLMFVLNILHRECTAVRVNALHSRKRRHE